MLNVVCMRWGEWPRYYVDRLRRGVARHLSLPHRFTCIENAPDLPGNLRKMWLYSRDADLQGRVLLLDLDTVITGSIDEIARYDGQFCVLEDLWQPGRAGGGVIAFDGGDPALEHMLWRPIVQDVAPVLDATKGQERFWLRQQLPWVDFWQAMYPGQIADAKPKSKIRQIIREVPEGARMVCFHGNPRPHEVRRDWLDTHWN